MMRIENRATASSVAELYRKPGAGAPPSGETAPARARPQVDILGVPEAELTPTVQRTLERLLDEVADLTAQVEGLRERLRTAEHLADEDPLVPLHNRRSFVRELQRMMAYAQRHAHPLSLLVLDLDGLKRINDAGGHAAGDTAIQEVAAVLTENTRASDLLGRLGGDEFGVLLMEMDREKALAAAHRIQRAIRARTVELPDGHLHLSAACGVCTFHEDMDSAAILRAADLDMYRQKAGSTHAANQDDVRLASDQDDGTATAESGQ